MGVVNGPQHIWGGPTEQEDRGNSRLLAVMAVIQIPVSLFVQLRGRLSGAGPGVWWFIAPQRGRGGTGGVGWSLHHPEDHAYPETSGVGCILNPNRGGLCCSLAVLLDLAVSRDFAVVRLAFSLDNSSPAPAPHLAPRSLRRSCFRSPSRCHSRFVLRPSPSVCWWDLNLAL